MKLREENVKGSQSADDILFLQRLTTEILKPRHDSSQQAAGDHVHRKLVEIRQSDKMLRQSQNSDPLVSVNEFGN